MIQSDVKSWLKHTADSVKKKFKDGREGHFDRLPKINRLTVRKGDVLHSAATALPPYELAVYNAFIHGDPSLGYVEEACQKSANAAPLRFREPGMAWVLSAKTAGAQTARLRELMLLDPDVKERTFREVYEETKAAQVRQTKERLVEADARGECHFTPSPAVQDAFRIAWDELIWPTEPDVVHSYTFPSLHTANVRTMGRFAAALKPGAYIPFFVKGQRGHAPTEAAYQASIAWGILGAFEWEFRRQRGQAPELRRASQLADNLARRFKDAGDDWYSLASRFLAALPGTVLLQKNDDRLFDPDMVQDDKTVGFSLASMVSNLDAFLMAIDWSERKAREVSFN